MRDRVERQGTRRRPAPRQHEASQNQVPPDGCRETGPLTYTPSLPPGLRQHPFSSPQQGIIVVVEGWRMDVHARDDAFCGVGVTHALGARQRQPDQHGSPKAGGLMSIIRAQEDSCNESAL